MNREERLFIGLSKDAYRECQRRAKAAGARSTSGYARAMIRKALDQPESTDQNRMVTGPFEHMMAIAFTDEDRARITEATEREGERTGMKLAESAVARLLLYRGMALDDAAPAEDNGSRKIRRAS